MNVSIPNRFDRHDSMPTTTPVAAFGTYAEAERALDALADDGFELERVAVVARGLKVVEHVVRRLSLLRAIANGASTGALVGAFLSLLFALFSAVPGLGLLVWGIALGATVGAFVGAATWLANGGRFATIPDVVADTYAVEVDDPAVADRAAAIIDEAQRGSLPKRGS